MILLNVLFQIECKNPVFKNRKGEWTINSALVCNADYEFLYVASGTPGRGHDSMIFRESGLYFMLQNGRHVPSPANALLAADSAYEVNYNCIFFVTYFTS